MIKLLGNGITSDTQLNRLGKKLFKTKWLGVFPSDVPAATIMPGIKPRSSFIINVDGSSAPGSHWLGIWWDGERFYIYDSYARKSTRIIPNFIKTIGYKHVDINVDADQLDQEDNCGARSMSFIVYINKFGVQSASGI